MNDVKIVNLECTMSDNEICFIIKKLHPILKDDPSMGFTLVIDGYDDDPRELYEIPECVSFFQRLVDIGFISLLEVSTRIEALKKISEMPGLGSLEVWLIATGQMKKGNTELSGDTMKKFINEILLPSNDKVEEIIAEIGKVTSGQHELKGFELN